MNSISSTAALWIGFSLFILFMLSLDLGLFNRRAHAIKYREAAIWSGIWVTLAMVFACIVFYYQILTWPGVCDRLSNRAITVG